MKKMIVELGQKMYSNTHKKGKKKMKVFISWSGECSKRIALIFRDWLPTVIQAIEPFVSSEDIEKGTRWNTDIAQELKDSSFGLICVTKDNLDSQWLNFEAGALSKSINNTYVAPLLFNVKPSDLKNSPISQFQATSFSKDDMKRLIETLNSATGNLLNPVRLDKAFELCYPELEKCIKELQEANFESFEDNDAVDASDLDPNILEELLETSRNTQRLLGNTDTKLYENIEQVNQKANEIIEKIDKHYTLDSRRNSRKMSAVMVEDLLFFAREKTELFPYNILVVLSAYKEDFPWIYESGNELIKILNSKSTKQTKIDAAVKFGNIIESTCEIPVCRETYHVKKECLILLRELPRLIFDMIEKFS